MPLDTLRLVEHVHGHLGWLSTALLVHPAVLLRRRDRRAPTAVALATASITGSAAIGAWLYLGYREHLKQRIFAEAPSVGLLFERKEHLAFGVVLLAWVGCASYFAAQRADGVLRTTLRTIAFRAYVASALLSVTVALLGTVTAITRSF